MTSKVRFYSRRRIGIIDGVEVHRPPLTRDIIMDVPEDAVLISRGHLESYEDRLQWDIESVGIEEQHVFVVREDGRVHGILIGFFDPDGANDIAYMDDVWREVLSTHAYIDALEVFDKRKGIGRKLIKAFEKWAIKQGASGIAGAPTDERSRRFDTSIGMKPHPEDYKLWVKEL